MKQWTINWISTKKAMPNKSGNYLTLKEFSNISPSVIILPFSKKYNAFNCHDYLPPCNVINVDFWAAIPKVELK